MSALEGGSPIDLGAVEPNELVRRALGGCADACTELSRRFRPRLLSLLRDRFGSQYSDAEDIVQEALARAFRQLDRFDPRYRFSTWLYTIAIRLAHDEARTRRRRPQQVSLDDVEGASEVSSAAAPATRQEEVDNVWQSARRVLSESQYTALWLHYGEDLPPVEVAKVMGRSRIGVRVLLHRARSALIAEIARRDSANAKSGLEWPEGGKT